MKHITQQIKQKKRSVIHFSFSKEKGISLLFVVLIAGVILAIGLGLSAILVQQLRMMGEVGYSVIAFYAADSGVEEALFNLYQSSPIPFLPYEREWEDGTLNTVSYSVSVTCGVGNTDECPSWFPQYTEPTDPDYCSTDYFCLKSIGSYRNVKRAIQTEY